MWWRRRWRWRRRGGSGGECPNFCGSHLCYTYASTMWLFHIMGKLISLCGSWRLLRQGTFFFVAYYGNHCAKIDYDLLPPPLWKPASDVLTPAAEVPKHLYIHDQSGARLNHLRAPSRPPGTYDAAWTIRMFKVFDAPPPTRAWSVGTGPWNTPWIMNRLVPGATQMSMCLTHRPHTVRSLLTMKMAAVICRSRICLRLARSLMHQRCSSVCQHHQFTLFVGLATVFWGRPSLIFIALFVECFENPTIILSTVISSLAHSAQMLISYHVR